MDWIAPARDRGMGPADAEIPDRLLHEAFQDQPPLLYHLRPPEQLGSLPSRENKRVTTLKLINQQALQNNVTLNTLYRLTLAYH